MEVRVDKYLWAMRIYKTRSIATDACKCGRVKMNGVEVKPSRMFHVGDIFTVRKGPITYTYRILQLWGNRLGAKMVPEYLQDITPKEQLELLELARYAAQMDAIEAQDALRRKTDEISNSFSRMTITIY